MKDRHASATSSCNRISEEVITDIARQSSPVAAVPPINFTISRPSSAMSASPAFGVMRSREIIAKRIRFDVKDTTMKSGRCMAPTAASSPASGRVARRQTPTPATSVKALPH